MKSNHTNEEHFKLKMHVWILNTFDTVKEFIYLGSDVTTKNDVSLEIKRRIILANRCYYGLNGQLSNRDLSRTTKLILYKTLILPVLLYGAEAWTFRVVRMEEDAPAWRVFDAGICGSRRRGRPCICWKDQIEPCHRLV